MRRFTALALPALVAAGLTGCAGATSGANNAGKFSGPAKDVAGTIDTLSTAVSKGDAKGICQTVLTSQLAARLSSPSRNCTTAIDKQLKAADVLDLQVTNVQVNGDQATATVRSTRSGHPATERLRLVRQRGSWRIAGFA